LRLTIDGHNASRGFSAAALVTFPGDSTQTRCCVWSPVLVTLFVTTFRNVMGKRHNTIVVNLQNERAMMATGIVPLSSPLLTYQNNKIQIKYEEKVTRQKAE